MKINVRWGVLFVVAINGCMSSVGLILGALSHPRVVAGDRRSVLLSQEFVIALCVVSREVVDEVSLQSVRILLRGAVVLSSGIAFFLCLVLVVLSIVGLD